MAPVARIRSAQGFLTQRPRALYKFLPEDAIKELNYIHWDNLMTKADEFYTEEKNHTTAASAMEVTRNWLRGLVLDELANKTLRLESFAMH